MHEHDSSMETAHERSQSLAEKRATAARWRLTLSGPRRYLLGALLKPLEADLQAVHERVDEAVQIEEHESERQHRERSEMALAEEHNSAQEYRERSQAVLSEEHESAQKHRARSEKMQEALAVAGVAIGTVVLGEISISIAAAVEPAEGEWGRATAETAAWMVGVGLMSAPIWILSFWKDSLWNKQITILGVAAGAWCAVILGILVGVAAKLDWPPQMANPLLFSLIPLRWVLLAILGLALGLPATALWYRWRNLPDLSANRWKLIPILSFIVVPVVVLAVHSRGWWTAHLP